MKRIILIFYLLAATVAGFSQATDQQLTSQANVIRNETSPGGNTKGRIADMFQAETNSKQSIYGWLAVEPTSNVYTVSVTAPVSYADRLWYVIKFPSANEGSATLNINSLGAKAIKKNTIEDLSAGDIVAGGIYMLAYDGTNFQIIGGMGSSGGGTGVQSVTGDGVDNTDPLNPVLVFPTKSDIGLGSVENTALSTWPGSSNITTLGTISTGSWNATTIPISKGGTGLTVVGSSLQWMRANSSANGIEYFTPTANMLPYSPSGGISATDVQAMGAELDAEKTNLLWPDVEFTTNHTGALTDINKVVQMNSASALTYTIPTNASVAFPIGTYLLIRNKGTGGLTIDQPGGVVLNLAEGASFPVSIKGVTVTAHKTATNTWDIEGVPIASSGGTGTVSDVSVVTANGVSGSVANSTTTPAITLTLGAITPTTVNGVTLSGSSTPSLAVAGTSSISGTNTGDQTSVSGNAGTATALQTARTIGIITGDGTSSGSTFNGTANNTNTFTLATVNSNVGTFGSATQSNIITVNGKGLVTAVSSQTVTPAITSVTGLGTGIATALANNTGSAGAPVLYNGSGGTPSSINLSNATSYPSATESLSGIAELATQTETDGFTDDARIVTPLKLHTNLKRRSTKTANFSVVQSDAGATLDVNGSSTITCTVDQLTQGDQIFITNRGTSNVSFAAGSGLALAGLATLKPGFAAVIDYNANNAATVYGGDVAAGSTSVLYQNTNQVAASGSSETDLYSYTMPANTLSATGESVIIDITGTFAASANTKTIRVKLGATTIFTTGALAITAATKWTLICKTIRVSDTSQKTTVTITSNPASSLLAPMDFTTSTETLSTSNILKVTGQGGASSDVVAEWVKITKSGSL